MSEQKEAEPQLHHRVLAAAGASVVSALLVNPLDVVKTRLQAAATVVTEPVPSCSLSTRLPIRWAGGGCSGKGRGSVPAPRVPQGVTGAQPQLRTGVPAVSLRLGRMPMASCACLTIESITESVAWVPGQHCHRNPYQPPSASGVLRDIVRKEGVRALWRGADTAIITSIPMVGVYMPLYDYLLARAAEPLGAYAPMVAGSGARTIVVALVAPLELVRTRQQGASSGSATAWGAIKDTLAAVAAPAAPSATAHAAGAAAATTSGRGRAGTPPSALGVAVSSSSSNNSGSGLRAALRVAPRLWTGLGATLGRDVPFSAIYWGLVEPIRGGLLRTWAPQQQQHAPHAPLHLPRQQRAASSSPAPVPAHSAAGSSLQPSGLDDGYRVHGLPPSGSGVHAHSDPVHGSHPIPMRELDAQQQQQYEAQASSSAVRHHATGAHGVRGDAGSSRDGGTADGHAGRHSSGSPDLRASSASRPESPLLGSDGGGEGLAGAAGGPSRQAILAANLIAGSAAGGAAAVVTTPFDVVKTQLQVADVAAAQRRSSIQVLRDVFAREGLAGIFRGWGPRAARTAPACAVVIASYEVLKSMM